MLGLSADGYFKLPGTCTVKCVKCSNVLGINSYRGSNHDSDLP